VCRLRPAPSGGCSRQRRPLRWPPAGARPVLRSSSQTGLIGRRSAEDTIEFNLRRASLQTPSGGVPTNDQAPLGAAITPLEEVAASLSEEDRAVLGAVEDASRPLRRCRNRHPRPRLCAALGRALPACTPTDEYNFPFETIHFGPPSGSFRDAYRAVHYGCHQDPSSRHRFRVPAQACPQCPTKTGSDPTLIGIWMKNLVERR